MVRPYNPYTYNANTYYREWILETDARNLISDWALNRSHVTNLMIILTVAFTFGSILVLI